MTEKRSEAFKELQPTLDQYAGVKGSLITILQKAQEIYGYLSTDCINHIADATGIKPAKIYGVATFYAQFQLNPKGEHPVSVCLGTACYVKGSGKIINACSMMSEFGRETVSAPAVRRYEAARHDRHGPGLPAQAADR